MKKKYNIVKTRAPKEARRYYQSYSIAGVGSDRGLFEISLGEIKVRDYD